MTTNEFSPLVANLIQDQWAQGRAVVIDNMRKNGEWKVQIRCCAGMMGSWFQRAVVQHASLEEALIRAIARSQSRKYAE